MGVYLENGTYVPDVGELTGWGDPVNADLAALDVLRGGGGPGGGGGGFANLIDVTAAPYSADPTGETWADKPIQDAYDAAFNLGPGHGVYLPGIFKIRKNLAKFEIGGITTRGVRGGKLLLGEDMGTNGPIYSNLGRHGYTDAQSTTDLDFIDVTIDGNDRAFSGDAWGGWYQAEDHTFSRVKVVNLKGTAFAGVGCRRVTLQTVRVIGCGDGAAGAPAMSWLHSDEGGTIGRLTEDLTMADVRVIDSDDMAAYLALIAGGSITGCVFDGSGVYRPGVFAVDLAGVAIVGNRFLNAGEDCLRLQSRGVADADQFSRRNVIVGNVALGEGGDGGGPWYGIREFVGNENQSHFENTIEHNVGTVHRD